MKTGQEDELKALSREHGMWEARSKRKRLLLGGFPELSEGR